MVDPVVFFTIAIIGGGLGLKVTSTQNPVYSGLYLVLSFFLGSAISLLLGLEFMALLFLLVYAGAIAVLVLFVVMMLDVKAVENPWSAKQKRILYASIFVFLVWLIFINARYPVNHYLSSQISFLVGFSFYPQKLNCDNFYDCLKMISYDEDTWFIDFDSSSSISDLSYLLYCTHAVLLLIAGIILLIAMVGAITLTLQKNCPDSVHRQLGRDSKNAVFSIKEKYIQK
uniref:NADH dehydrogenase subunit 6 n=1 Tax=Scytothamnus australis TaxID=66621 RepID=UPI002E76769D|nr:NADH dehydrogenase subunit 6 [Scytothamnus australis]WBP70314.1 NADH dehydrogenase subunit 6 [Scytothamnus australis]